MKFKFMFAVVMLIQLFCLIGIGYLGYLLVDGILSYGLSGVIDKIWLGPNK